MSSWIISNVQSAITGSRLYGGQADKAMQMGKTSKLCEAENNCRRQINYQFSNSAPIEKAGDKLPPRDRFFYL